MTRCSAGPAARSSVRPGSTTASAPARNKLGFGTCFVVIGRVVDTAVPARPVCLPVLARLLAGPEQAASRKADIAASTVRFAAAWSLLAGRSSHVGRGRRLPRPGAARPARHVTWTTRLPANAVLYDLAPPRTGKRGRPALKGARLGTPAELAAAARLRAASRSRATAAPTPWTWPRSPACGTAACTPSTVRVILARDDTDTGYAWPWSPPT